MASLALDIRFDDAREQVRRFWSWWVGELTASLPNRLREGLARRPKFIEVAIEGGTARISLLTRAGIRDIATLDLAAPSEAPPDFRHLDVPVVARLASENVLRKRLTLPSISARGLRAILVHEAPRHIPIDPACACWTFTVLARDKARKRSEIELQIIKRDTIEGAIAACAAIGLAPSGIACGEGALQTARFPITNNRKLNPRVLWRRHGLTALCLLAGTLVLANIVHDHCVRTQQATALASEIRRLRPDVDAVQVLREEIAAIGADMKVLVGGKRGTAIDMLNEITKTLPDNTWVFDLQAAKDRLALRGYSAEAASLIARFDKSRLFRDAEFQAPLTKGGTDGRDRFDLALKYRGAS